MLTIKNCLSARVKLMFFILERVLRSPYVRWFDYVKAGIQLGMIRGRGEQGLLRLKCVIFFDPEQVFRQNLGSELIRLE